MAGRSRKFDLDPEVFQNLLKPVRRTILPPLPFSWEERREEERKRRLPEEHWRRNRGQKIAFGSEGRLLSITQAKRRKLLRWDFAHQVYVRSVRSKEAEDRLLREYDERIERQRIEKERARKAIELDLIDLTNPDRG